MYEMYHWDQPDPAALTGAGHPGRGAGRARRRGGQAGGTGHTGPGGRGTGPAAQAVQVALDRRDNGGDSCAPCDQ